MGGSEVKVQPFCKTAAVGGEEGESPRRHQNLRGGVLQRGSLLHLGSQPPPVSVKVCSQGRKQMEISPDTSIPNCHFLRWELTMLNHFWGSGLVITIQMGSTSAVW